MAISKAYQDTIKRRLIESFVKDNKRSPTKVELRELLKIEHEKYSTVDTVGLSGYELEVPKFAAASSAATENANRRALIDDVLTVNKRLDTLSRQMEMAFRGFVTNSNDTSKTLTKLERRLDSLLLANTGASNFVNAVEETFDSFDKVDYTQTTAAIEGGYVTLNRKGYTTIDLDSVTLGSFVQANKGVISSTGSSPVSNLKSIDGTFWEYVVETNYKQGRVNLILNIELDEAKYISEFKLSGRPLAVNKSLKATMLYSVDGETFTEILPVEKVITQAETVFQVSKENVKKLQLILSKDAADTQNRQNGNHQYIFALDSISLYEDQYRSDGFSQIVLGPYTVTDPEDNAIFFTKAKCETCVYEPEDTSISFYLSQNGTDWTSVNTSGDGLNFITFGDSSASLSQAFQDATANAGSIMPSNDLPEEVVDWANEATLNVYITEAYVPKVPVTSMVIKRNTYRSDYTDEILNAPSSWSFDPATGYYKTVVYVDAIEGKTIDFGPYPIIVNGQAKSNEVTFLQGYSTVLCPDNAWEEIDTGMANIDALKAADPLYPYNQRYLISGYSYPGTFTGEQLYNGVGENFGALLEYVSPEVFSSLEVSDDLYYNSFTVEDFTGVGYIKVKVNKADSSWSEERYSYDWTVQSAATNTLYVKATLSSSNPNLTPYIEDFKIQCI